MDFEIIFSNYVSRFENLLSEKLNKLDKNAPAVIKDAISYAITDGGKRIRPVLLYATADMLNVNLECVDNFALSIEMIHSYSLVHDDLPSMDNDDYRRGKLSTHKKFGEAIGVLAGDALLNLAFETALDKEYFNNYDYKALKLLGEYSGYNGMIAGQILDIQAEKSSNLDFDSLYNIHVNKTGKLITAPLLIASIFANYKYYDELFELGKTIGLIFQITDDIMDVEGSFETIGKTTGKDQNENKLTSVKLLGLDGAKKYNQELYQTALQILKKFENSEFMTLLVNKLVNRKK